MDYDRENVELHSDGVVGPPPVARSFGSDESGAPRPLSHHSNEAGPSQTLFLASSPPGLNTEEPRRISSPTNFHRPVDGEVEYNPNITRNFSQTRSENQNQHHELPPSSPGHRSGEASRRGTGGPEMPRAMDAAAYSSHSRKSNLDWIVPLGSHSPLREKSSHRAKTVEERLQPTLDEAERERAKYALKAQMTGIALNVAIGMQVLLGALTTALSAATSGRSTSIGVSILGGLATLVASYLARARGSGEPEQSNIKVRDLDQFVRECKAFMLDYGNSDGHEHDEKINTFRQRFEHLLGNGVGSMDPSLSERVLQHLGFAPRNGNPAPASGPV